MTTLVDEYKLPTWLSWCSAAIALGMIELFVVIALFLDAFFFTDSFKSSLFYKGGFHAVFALLVALWVMRDAEARRFPLPRMYVAAAAVVPEIGVPFYIYKTRGIGLGALALAKCALFALLAAALLALAEKAVS
jgi:hypothetical protein